MNPLQLKKDIKSKFKTVSRFSELSGIAEGTVRYILSGRSSAPRVLKAITDLSKIVKTIEVPNDPRYITENEREEIRRTIVVNYRSISNFVDLYKKDFSISYVSNIITGRRLKKSDRYNRLTTILKLSKNAT